MDSQPLDKSWSLTVDEPLFERLFAHLFPGDADEHGAVLTAGIVETPRGTRLLARDLLIAEDGIDYVPGTRGYRALTARFVAEHAGYCAEQKLCYLAVHCHGGTDSVTFSSDDLASHERGYSALLDITHGGPVGALVFAANAVAGDIWTPTGRFQLDSMRIVGTRMKNLYSRPQSRSGAVDPVYDRHARMFGDKGQAILARLKVGIIGAGGGGSLISEWLARLGVGHLVVIDPDRVELSNLPRIVGASRRDARLAKPKVDVARRVACQANPSIRFEAVVGDVLNSEVAKVLRDVDFLFLATDTIQSRLVFNALVHQYLIPGIQVGAKVAVSGSTVGDVFVATRPVIPGHPCLDCYDLIPAGRLREEALNSDERRRQRYVEHEDVAEPSVITLNVLSAGQAVNDFLMMFTGLFKDNVRLDHQLNFVRERVLHSVDEPAKRPSCLDCGEGTSSRKGRGDRARLPCRMTAVD